MRIPKLFLLTFFLIISLNNYGQEDSLPINKIQVIGSHNSYKQAIDAHLFKNLLEKDSTALLALEYEHISIPDQLVLGLRNLEIDIYADTLGNKYASPLGSSSKSRGTYDPDGLMSHPGFKVLHIPDIDFRSSCLTFQGCLQQLKNWSDDDPGHTPVFITLEAKDKELLKLNIVPEKFTYALFQKLDSVIKRELGVKKIITPDLVRGNYETLEKAILDGNWPTLKDAMGKFLFILDDTKDKRELYIKDTPSLKGRVLFVNANPGTPEAATLIRNDPFDPEIPKLVRRGYIIRTRADSNTNEARANDYDRFKAACNSGAQIITTDYYQKSSFFISSYRVSFENNLYVRPNPLFSE
ncbi:phosphatidylinositol-specific phospholipase C1-like protein [Salegentibacter sp. LM13S]|uniref:phosphatidylinositol-specific phospholipase C1-like protein n=1 Tax=Salegentibacter lacus TaxID=2873599 RepID=UPI001CCE70A4|nr:phosphatidylinositol-specific phospholipase C1-like protein [Salegentibacter lacus]MBZ9630964.1 phosphatidylinositol-specific phospholipase C1-like protein [Salegentibacter lacus]